MMSDLRLLRDRIDESAGDIDRAGGDVAPCASALIVQTTTLTTYPTAFGEYYYCKILALTGAETEGGAGTLTDTGARIYVYITGSGTVPAAGTNLIATAEGDRWMARYG